MKIRAATPGVLAARAAAAVSLVLIVATCARPPRAVDLGREPEMRIGLLVDVQSVTLSAESGLLGIVAGNSEVRSTGSAGLTLTRQGSGVSVAGGAGDGTYPSITLRASGNRPVLVNGAAYRGRIEVIPAATGITVVNLVPIEAYLGGVVGVELGHRAAGDYEAVKAQAVVARTYAIKNRGKSRALGFDLYASVSDQAYVGVRGEYELGNRAVRETRGRVATYNGIPISVFFHSTCGYRTADPEEVFATVRSTPYLRSVSDRNGDGYYCDISPHFRWTVEWTYEELTGMLRETVPPVTGTPAAEITTVREVRAAATGATGRITELRISTELDDLEISGPYVRGVLRKPDGAMLGSNAVQFSETGVGSGKKLIGAGAGWGHGVGMCQWGAIGRARAGQSYEEIITTYFPGTRVDKIYS